MIDTPRFCETCRRVADGDDEACGVCGQPAPTFDESITHNDRRFLRSIRVSVTTHDERPADPRA